MACPGSDSADAEQPDFGARRNWRRRVAMTGWSFAAVLCVFGLIFYLLYGRTTSLYSLVPESCAQLAVGDAPWWWDSLQDVRREPSVMLGLGVLEKQLGISIKDDILPWVGQVGLAVMDTGDREPRAAVFAEVRNLRMFARSSSNLRKASESGGSLVWHDVAYHGIALRQSRVPAGYGPPMVVSVALIRRWIVIGIGEGAVEKVIDTWQGRARSMEQSACWSEALSSLPRNPRAVWAMDSRRTLGLGGSGLNVCPPALRCDFLNAVLMSTLSESDGGLRIQVVNAPCTVRAQERWKAFKKSIKPVIGSAVKKLPGGVSAAILISNPGSWAKQIKSIALDVTRDTPERAALSQELYRMQPFYEIADRLEGECAAALAWQQDKGFGVVALGEARSASSAGDIGQKLRQLAVADGQKVIEDHGVYEIPPEGQIADDFKGLPCWTSRERWFILGSHPAWLTSMSRCALELPDEAKNADAAFIINLRSLVPIFARSSRNSTAEPQSIPDILRKLDLENAEVYGWTRFSEDGRHQESVITIPHFDWRKALKTIVRTSGGLRG